MVACAEGAARTATSAAAERANGILERFCFFRVIREIFRTGAALFFIEGAWVWILRIGSEGLGLKVGTAEVFLRGGGTIHWWIVSRFYITDAKCVNYFFAVKNFRKIPVTLPQHR